MHIYSLCIWIYKGGGKGGWEGEILSPLKLNPGSATVTSWSFEPQIVQVQVQVGNCSFEAKVIMVVEIA